MNPEKIIKGLYEDFQLADKTIKELKNLLLTEEKAIYEEAVDVEGEAIHGIKELKNIHGIKELKEACFHLIRWNLSKEEKDLYEAQGQVKQAIYESSYFGMELCLKQIEKFNKHYYLSKFINSDYSKKRLEAQDIKKEYVKAIEQKRSLSRESNKAFSKSKEILSYLRGLQPDLNKDIILIAIPIVTVILAVITVIITLFK
ncbi:MAG: hypothetical protein FWC26_03875 [Fibromonadales bacterium]|nr:hypothetical protein [Fibromonadales bacterium]